MMDFKKEFFDARAQNIARLREETNLRMEEALKHTYQSVAEADPRSSLQHMLAECAASGNVTPWYGSAGHAVHYVPREAPPKKDQPANPFPTEASPKFPSAPCWGDRSEAFAAVE